MERPTIKRGDLVRRSIYGSEYFGTAIQDELQPGVVQVEWHRDYSSYEHASDLTVVTPAKMGAK